MYRNAKNKVTNDMQSFFVNFDIYYFLDVFQVTCNISQE